MDVKNLNNQLEELKEEKREKEEIIDKMEEEKKTMQAEIENHEKLFSYSNDYIGSYKIFILSYKTIKFYLFKKKLFKIL